MRDIDPSDPIYDGLTKAELAAMKYLSREDKEALSMRLFGESLYGPPPLEKQREQRWAALLGETPTRGDPYRFTHQRLLQRIEFNQRSSQRGADGAGALSPRTPTVSAFADWVLRLYAPPPNPISLLDGIIGERAVVDRRAEIHRAKFEIPRWEHRGWRLVHDGVRRTVEDGFPIPSLTVDGVPLRGVPDLVFRERKSNRILIVELKVSSAELPSDGWPNLRAQLWAYSHIQHWATASEILLAGEVWSNHSSSPVRRKTYFWRSNDTLLNEECLELFIAYGGAVEDQTT